MDGPASYAIVAREDINPGLKLCQRSFVADPRLYRARLVVADNKIDD
jgi:hypothetical protein